MMKTLAQQQSGLFNCGVNTANMSRSWQCYYQADEDLFLAPEHIFFTKVSVPQNMDKLGQKVLNLHINMVPISARSLKNARIRVMVRNSTGSSVLNWTSDSIDQMKKTGVGETMCVSIPMSKPVLKRLKPAESNRFYVILEDCHENVLDNATGEIMFHRYCH